MNLLKKLTTRITSDATDLVESRLHNFLFRVQGTVGVGREIDASRLEEFIGDSEGVNVTDLLGFVLGEVKMQLIAEEADRRSDTLVSELLDPPESMMATCAAPLQGCGSVCSSVPQTSETQTSVRVNLDFLNKSI